MIAAIVLGCVLAGVVAVMLMRPDLVPGHEVVAVGVTETEVHDIIRDEMSELLTVDDVQGVVDEALADQPESLTKDEIADIVVEAVDAAMAEYEPVLPEEPEPELFGEGGCTIRGVEYDVSSDSTAVWLEEPLLSALVEHGGLCTIETFSKGWYWSEAGEVRHDEEDMPNGSVIPADPGGWTFWYAEPSEANGFTIRDNIPESEIAPEVVSPPPVEAAVVPIEAWCQLGVTQMTDNVPIQSLSWDVVQLRGYMNDQLSHQIWSSTAYCKTVFPTSVTLLFDSVAGDPIRVDGREVQAGNGRIESGRVFEWVYPNIGRPNGHAYVVQ